MLLKFLFGILERHFWIFSLGFCDLGTGIFALSVEDVVHFSVGHQEGFREGNDMVCEVCGDGDHVFFSMVVVVIVGAGGSSGGPVAALFPFAMWTRDPQNMPQ